MDGCERLPSLSDGSDQRTRRLLLNGRVKAEWGASENDRRARYTLTPAGRKQLAAERQEFARIVLGVDKVLTTA
jgi:PadR family transcriptional regulator PadR